MNKLVAYLLALLGRPGSSGGEIIAPDALQPDMATPQLTGQVSA